MLHTLVRIDEGNPCYHDLENRLNGGQCLNKIGGVHLHHADIAIHDNLLKMYSVKSDERKDGWTHNPKHNSPWSYWAGHM